MDQLLAALRIPIDDQEYKNEYEIENEHPNGPTEAVNIATTDAFAEEDTVMIIVVDTNLAFITMFHILLDINVAFYAVEYFYSLAILAFSMLPLGLVIFCIDRCL